MTISHICPIAAMMRSRIYCSDICGVIWLFHIINITVHGCLEIRNVFLVLNMQDISLVRYPVRQVSTLEINLIFPHIYMLHSYTCHNSIISNSIQETFFTQTRPTSLVTNIELFNVEKIRSN